MAEFLVYYTVEPEKPLPPLGPSRPAWRLCRATSPKMAAVEGICKDHPEDVTAFVVERDARRWPSGVPFVAHRFDLKITRSKTALPL